MRAAFVLAGLVAASCAITPQPTALPELDTVPASFEMSGRLAVRQGDRSDIAKLRWTHHQGGDVWVISSPIGNEVPRIESGGGAATPPPPGAAPAPPPHFLSPT